jgi:hypothetical protein
LPSLLLQIADEDLTSRSRKRIEAFRNQEWLDYGTLIANNGVDPGSQIEVAKEIRSDPRKYAPLLNWRGMPTWTQIYGVCNLIWKPFKCVRLGGGSAKKPNQLGVRLIELHSSPSTRSLIDKQFAHHKDADEAVKQVLDFQRLWAGFHFPQLLRALDRIQRDVFRRLRMPSGDYDFYASRIENLFTNPALVAFEEYGIPLEVGKKLSPLLMPFDNLDGALERLRRLSVEKTHLSDFEKSLVRDAQKSL